MDKRKQSLYLPTEMLADIMSESKRLGRPMSWIIQRVWELSKKEIKKIPSQDAEQ
jgi:uncharacterized small protein (TIGR04563 family)